jgi:hypothetical protein
MRIVSIIDEIYRVLARHYCFTDPPSPRLWRASEELDFIINYDIKYRMGGADDEEED